jgi:hypothetical protein
MIAFACVLLVVTCSWFGYNAKIVLHANLFEITLEFASIPIVKDNKLRLRVTCQPGVMNTSWIDIADMFVDLTISN